MRSRVVLTGEHLRRVREEGDLLQPDFADALGVHPVTLSKYERDVDPITNVVELAVYELASRLGVRDVLPVVKLPSCPSRPRKLATKKKTK